MAVAHFAVDLGARHERGHRVDDDDVEGTGADQHVGDLEGLLTAVGLRNEQCVGVDAQSLGVFGIEGVLGIDEGRDSAGLLGIGHRVEGDSRLARRLRAVDFDDAATGQTADAEGDVEGRGTGGNDFDRRAGPITKAHDGTLAVGAVDLRHRIVERPITVLRLGLLCLGGGDFGNGHDDPSCRRWRVIYDARRTHRQL